MQNLGQRGIVGRKDYNDANEVVLEVNGEVAHDWPVVATRFKLPHLTIGQGIVPIANDFAFLVKRR